MKIVSNKPTITRKELESVLDCLINDELSSGGTVKAFESSIAHLLHIKYALAANSLVSAYDLVFKALEIDENSEVIIPSFFDQAPLSALKLSGGIPVLTDLDENSFFPSKEQISNLITEKTKAIVVGHTFGYHFDINELSDLNIPIIEDISHAIGSDTGENEQGKGSSFKVISFAPSMMITSGNGGMVLTGNSKHFSAMRDLRGGNSSCINYDYTMTDFQAAMGISQITKISGFIKRRRDIARIYNNALKMTSHKNIVNFNEKFAYQNFPVIFNTLSDKITKYWKKLGIEVTKPIEFPLHRLLDKRGLDYPNSDRMSKKLYSIPIYPTLTKKEIERISKALASFI